MLTEGTRVRNQALEEGTNIFYATNLHPLQLPLQVSRFKIIKITLLSVSSEKLKRGRTLTTSQYTITHILYFKIQKSVIEHTKVTY